MATLTSMTHCVAHRGPDGVTLTDAGQVGLGFTRLSLVDPVSGQQPLTSEDEQVLLIANGEVYNHRELEASLRGRPEMRSRSDCAVLVHLYQQEGLRFLDRVVGMFALVIWDRRKQLLIMARDRFGIKPLYYARQRDRVSFASEIKALFADPACSRRLSWERALTDQAMSAATFFSHEEPTTWFDGIASVPAGCIVTLDVRTGEMSTHRYWKLPLPGEAATDASSEEIISRYRELLVESVTGCATADTELGLFLSGGVDSAAVGAIAAQTTTLHAFTAVTGTTAINGDAESAYHVAHALGLPLHHVLFERDRVPTAVDWKHLLWLLETPLCGPEQYYKYEMHRYAKANRPELRGMLLGQASDEFAGGYTAELSGGGGWDDLVDNLTAMARQTRLLGSPRLAAWSQYGPSLLTDAALGPQTGMPLTDPYAAFVLWKYRDIQQYNCWHEDRTAAGSGIEARVPFLDHRLVELTSAIPVSQRRELLWDKRLVREAVRGLLPDDIVNRPKVAFFHGHGAQHTRRIFIDMLSHDDAALLREAFASTRAQEFISPSGAHALLRTLQKDPDAAPVEILLRLVNLGLLENMLTALPEPPIAWRPGSICPAVDASDWATARQTIMERTLRRRPIDQASVPRLGQGVMLLQAASDAGWLVAVDGRLAYQLDEEDCPEWLRFLRAVDGCRSVARLVAEAGCRFDSIADLLSESADLGLLEFSDPTDEGTADFAKPALVAQR